MLVVGGTWNTAPRAQQTPLPPGHGFSWMQVGHEAFHPQYLHFDPGGTLWVVHSDTPRWLDLRPGWPGHWQQPVPPVPRPTGLTMVALGPHRAGGPPRSDTILVASYRVNRSVTAGATWEGWQGEMRERTLFEVPAGHPHAGRLFVGSIAARSLDRGATWEGPLYDTEALPFEVYAYLSLPPAGLLPGAASGRDVAAPPGWPAGRIVAAGYNALAIHSDDGGTTWTRDVGGFRPGLRGRAITLVRRPDTHPLGPGPRLLITLSGDVPAASVWSSDDAGQTWVRRANLPEPGDGPGWPSPATVLALPEPGETDLGAGGRALVVLGRGHLYQTTDGGDTWQVVGRAPGVSTNSHPVTTAALGPDGHLYTAAVSGWVWRTSSPFAVSSEEAPEAPSVGVSLTVEPNPVARVVRLSLAGAWPVGMRVTVVDALGRRVAAIEVATGTPSVDLDVSRWPPGMYAARAEGADVAAVVRFTVAR